jgi:hypothetical protein
MTFVERSDEVPTFDCHLPVLNVGPIGGFTHVRMNITFIIPKFGPADLTR